MRSVSGEYMRLVAEPLMHEPWLIPWNEVVDEAYPVRVPYSALVEVQAGLSRAVSGEGEAAMRRLLEAGPDA